MYWELPVRDAITQVNKQKPLNLLRQIWNVGKANNRNNFAIVTD